MSVRFESILFEGRRICRGSIAMSFSVGVLGFMLGIVRDVIWYWAVSKSGRLRVSKVFGVFLGEEKIYIVFYEVGNI